MNGLNLNPALLLEIINLQTDIARQGLDLGGVMQLVCQRAGALCGASAAVVELAEGGEMVYRAAAGVAEGALGLRLKRDGSLSGLCVAEDRILRCDDSETDARVDREACRKVGLRSMLVVPLRHEGQSVGVLKVGAPQTDAFGQQQAQILGLLSELIGAAIFHAVQYESSDLYYRATHDALTSLANRALFYDRLRQQLAQAKRGSGNVAVLNIDMDGLKAINDNLGHRAGDAAICQVATRIARELRQEDLAARLGGDEFGILLCGSVDRDGVGKKCNSITHAIGAPFEFEGRALRLGASIGYAVTPDDGQEMDQLIELADKAMYRVKQARKAVAA
ncbi:sensor domain-containing diguanylate cyclase [Pseudoduganella violaceinigra]|uniref:sensor domain-containing diguanylate cyclase n=1 Tax=Pseudoduganella violaceinigra TaxID=246602 RepID=UPI0004833EBA|nr:sensor domain-containing diguanylate cyclase [Pseudoduganella violaceinigra]